MNKIILVKVNQKTRGYTEIWPGGKAALGTRVVDEALPPLDTDAIPPCVAYTATKIAPDRVFLAVGSYWPRLTDEFSRPGLYFWHGLVCDLPEFGVRQVSELTSMLIGLVQWYETAYDLVGDLIEAIAKGRAEQGWLQEISRFGLGAKLPRDMRDIIRLCDVAGGRVNVTASLPLDKLAAIPVLLNLLCKGSIARIVGGSAAKSRLSRFDGISLPQEVPGFRTVNLADCLSLPTRRSSRPIILGTAALITSVLGFLACLGRINSAQLEISRLQQALAESRDRPEKTGRELATTQRLLKDMKKQLATGPRGSDPTRNPAELSAAHEPRVSGMVGRLRPHEESRRANKLEASFIP